MMIENDTHSLKAVGQPAQVPPDHIVNPAPPAPNSFAGKFGRWAYNHKGTFEDNVAVKLTFRTFVRIALDIVAYGVVNIGVQHFFHHNIDNGRVNLGPLNSLAKNKVFQSSMAIFSSFSLFRTISKTWVRNYDRIFGAKTPEDASRAVADLPYNIVKDVGDISPKELASTGFMSIALAGIRVGFKNGVPDTFGHDWLANALGYSVFFEGADHIYEQFAAAEEKRKARHDPALKKELEVRPQKPVGLPYGRYTEDTPTRLLFRDVASVCVSALPFMAAQRYGFEKAIGNAAHYNAKTGGMPYYNTHTSYLKNFKVCMAGWVVPFAIFGTGIEAYKMAYDNIWKKLQDHEIAHRREQARLQSKEPFQSKVEQVAAQAASNDMMNSPGIQDTSLPNAKGGVDLLLQMGSAGHVRNLVP